MVLVKVLGAVDIAAAVAFLMMIFGMDVFLQFVLFCAGLLLLKGLFVLSGDILSIIDLFAAFLLILSIFFTPFMVFLWIVAFLLLGKGFISFL